MQDGLIQEKGLQSRIPLEGIWRFGFEGEEAEDIIELPSTTEISKKGVYAPDREQTLYLSRKYPYTGKAFYEREIEIPGSWKDGRVVLFLERTKYTEIFVDGRRVSQSRETLVPQRHDLTEALTAAKFLEGQVSTKQGSGSRGRHLLRIVVDNDLTGWEDFPESLLRGHQYTEHTQTNWNGILGKIYLEYREACLQEVPQVIGDPDRKGFRIRVRGAERVTASGTRSDGALLPEKNVECLRIGDVWEAFYPLEEDAMVCWDEFHPVFYQLQITAEDSKGRRQHYSQCAGIRRQEIAGKRIRLNDVPVFLRGTVDCCIYPRTGAGPMDRQEWRRIFDILKSYGLNHCRFHSWCPPEEAFCAADEAGIYLQAELSNFANALYKEESPSCDSVLNRYICEQAEKVLLEYGNHPSFLLFAVGNEMTGDLEKYERLITHLRTVRPDKLYTQGANNFLEHPACSRADDCWIIMRTDEKTNIRASFSHGDLPLGYLQTGEEPSTMRDYAEGVEQSPLPLISHEIGQYQCYPDYREIEKYTGPLSPENLKIFQRRLAGAGMGELGERFFRASGALAVQCYREEIEAALRTEGMAGFQLLGLQDFPGQGTALVGILDSFLDSKGLIAPEEFRRFCADKVLLAKFSRYVWQEEEPFCAEILYANYGSRDSREQIRVTLCGGAGDVLAETALEGYAPRGKLTNMGSVDFTFPKIPQAEQMKLRICAGDVENEYPLWVYRSHSAVKADTAGDLLITGNFDESAQNALLRGRTVLLFTDKIKEEHSVSGFFTPDFWCWPMFREACAEKNLPAAPGTLGMLCDKTHPVFEGFPTQDYAQWQWQPILYYARPVILDGWGAEIEPLVQIIDNFDRNHRLGLLFEVRIREGGRLLLCACDMIGQINKPQVRQLYESIVRYGASQKLQPAVEVGINEIKKLFV